MTSSTINTTQVLNLIHKATSRLKEKEDPDLKMLTESAISIFSFYFKAPFAFVRPEQATVIKKLQDYLK